MQKRLILNIITNLKHGQDKTWKDKVQKNTQLSFIVKVMKFAFEDFMFVFYCEAETLCKPKSVNHI